MTTLYYDDSASQSFTALRLDLIDAVTDTESELITDLPLESGRNVSDNAVSEPRKIALTATVSPLVAEEGRSADLASEVWELLRNIKRNNTFVTLIDELSVVTDLIIESIERVQDFQTSTSLACRIELRRIEFIDVQFSAINRTKVAKSVENTTVEFTQEQLDEIFNPEPAEDKTSQVDKGAIETVESPEYYDFNDFNFGNQTNIPIFNPGG